MAKKSIGCVLSSLAYHNAWCVGGACDFLLERTDALPRDYDVFVPHDRWSQVSSRVHSWSDEIRVNRLGGLKLVLAGGVELDLWPDTLERLVQWPKFKAAVHLLTLKEVRCV